MKRPLKSWQVYIQCRGTAKTREKLFQTIWNLYRKRLTFFIRNIVGDDAEDVLQEIMLKVFENIEKFNPLYSFNTWIYSITRNHCVNYRGKRRLPIATGDPENKPAVSASLSNSPEDDIIYKELYLKIDRILDTFSENNRQIAFLRFYEGMKLGEISRIMNIPTGTVKSRLHKSRSILKKALETYNER